MTLMTTNPVGGGRMATKLAPPLRVDCPRDKPWKRPIMDDPTTGKSRVWQRVTTLAGMIDDTHNLTLWKMRQVALGIAWRDDLRIAAATTDAADADGKRELDAICEKAMDAAGSGAGAAMGTAFHRVCQIAQAYPDVENTLYCPPELRGELAAYLALVAAHGLVMPVEYQERTGMCPQVGAAGTWDDLALGGPSCPCGRLHVVDKKSGQREWEYGQGKIAAQLAIYARFEALWLATGGGYEPVPDICPEVGYVISVPIGRPDDACIYPVDLVAGWDRAKLAVDIREARAVKRGLFGEALTLPGARMANDDPTFDESTGRGLAPVKPKRTRRTKAQIAADAAEAERMAREKAHLDRITEQDIEDARPPAPLGLTGNETAWAATGETGTAFLMNGELKPGPADALDGDAPLPGVTVTKAADVAAFLAGAHDEVPTLETGTAFLLNGELKPGPALKYDAGASFEAGELTLTTSGDSGHDPVDTALDALDAAVTDAQEKADAAVALLADTLGAQVVPAVVERVRPDQAQLARERAAAYAGLKNGTTAQAELAAVNHETEQLAAAIMAARGRADLETAYGLWSTWWTPEHDLMAVRRLIALAGDLASLEDVWREYAAIWTDELTEAGNARLAELGA